MILLLKHYQFLSSAKCVTLGLISPRFNGTLVNKKCNLFINLDGIKIIPLPSRVKILQKFTDFTKIGIMPTDASNAGAFLDLVPLVQVPLPIMASLLSGQLNFTCFLSIFMGNTNEEKL